MESTDDYDSDMSIESSFIIQIPLDGSTVCGAELQEAVSNSGLMHSLMTPSMLAFMGRLGLPDSGARLAEAMTDLKAKNVSSKL